MNRRGSPRKVQEENPGASAASRATSKKSTSRNKEELEDKKSSDAKASCISKLQESQQVRPRKSPRDAKSTEDTQEPKAVKCSERKVASRSSARKDTSVEERPGKPTQTADTKVSSSSKQQGSQETRLRKSPKDASSTEDTQASKPAKDGEKKAAPACSRRCSSIDDDPTKVLQAALEKLKLKKKHRSESAKCVNDIQNTITEHLKLHLPWCKDISVLKTGSYYENVKICEPDEFDVMLTVIVERVKLMPFTEDGAFYSVEMKRTQHILKKFVNEDDTIMASEMLNEFRDVIKKAISTLQYDVKLERKKMGCPAVTVLVNEKGRDISIDFVLGLEVHSSWPDFTQNGFSIENWLGKKVKMEQKRKPFYLVPKHEGRGNTEQGGIMAKDAWRISFSHVEKHILKNHGNSKTCCEGGQKCCRKKCLKLLKYLLQRLKEEHSEEADKLCSYHAKTTLLHACAKRVKDSEWADSELSYCFQQLLEDFEEYLRTCQLPNFFIPSQNLLNGISKKKCLLLAGYIENQRNNGFPLLC